MANDYVDDMQKRLLATKQKLKDIAAPHVKLPALDMDMQISARSERKKKKFCKMHMTG